MTKEEPSRLELVVPPNLLKQENVCLIPREAEHPSNIYAVVWVLMAENEGTPYDT